MPGPRWRGWPDLPEQGDDGRPTAALTYETHHNGQRHTLSVDGRDSRDIDRKIVQAIGNIRAGGHRMVKTEMNVNGDEWTYEYDSTGQVQHVFRNGESTP